MKLLNSYCLLLIACCLLFTACKGKTSDTESLVVATSSWTAAYARIAGADSVYVLAPIEMEHPSEYELRMSDIARLQQASLIVYAGYEVMTDRLKTGLDLPPDRMLYIHTDYDFASIEKAVLDIAERLGTTDIACINLEAVRHELSAARETLKALVGQPIVVHRFQVSLAKEFGITPVAIFGPGAPEAAQIAEVARTQAVMIIDNLHNPVGQPFLEALPTARYVQFLNFPGLHQTTTLADVIRFNASIWANP